LFVEPRVEATIQQRSQQGKSGTLAGRMLSNKLQKESAQRKPKKV
jgi:hypothetical protein